MIIGAGFLGRKLLFGAPTLINPPQFEVDRLAVACSRSAQGVKVWARRYRASATVTLLAIPVFSRADVGTGFTVIEDASDTVAIQFGAGSFPENAHGLNRLGYIQEVVDGRECAYFAFMTSSQEKSLDQAQKALANNAAMVPYAAAEGIGKDGAFHSRLDRIAFPSKLTWRDYPLLIDKVRAAVAGEEPTETTKKEFGAEAVPATFLYLVRKALRSPAAKTSGRLIYNGKEFDLHTTKEHDASVGAKMAARGIVGDAARVQRLDATLFDHSSGVTTPFRIWFEDGAQHMPPLRFDYQARSFLRLSFEYDPAAAGPSPATSIASKENS